MVMKKDTEKRGDEKHVFLPTEHTKNQVENKKRANQDECGEVDPRPFHSNGIIYLSDC